MPLPLVVALSVVALSISTVSARRVVAGADAGVHRSFRRV
jgi:hypothetical protein